ncbi:putative bifunctional diguanylate cyclase/phosphodiesterase [Modestobacter sp. SSW1-42]|uniref:putative bifunctional diguanylate cyclase/phosphodiesterase n=1 Tax=Modestobacter sp. SSW1-42 TaxID=596372 RepID=UPI003987C891
MTSGVLAAPARAVAAPARGGPAAPPLARHLLLALAAALLTTAAGFVPGVEDGPSVTLNLSAVVVVAVLLARSASRTAHPRAWRCYSAAVLAGGAGAVVASMLLPWGQTALGSVPGQLLVVAAIGQMIDRRALRAARAQLATSFALFVVADLLVVHTTYHLFVPVTGEPALSATVTLFALLFCTALCTGVSLLAMSVSGTAGRRVAGLVFAGQCAASVASTASAVTTGPQPLQYVACGASVLGLALVLVACRHDVPAAGARRPDPVAYSSRLGSLLPHATATVGGVMLLSSVWITGEVTVFGTGLGAVGLCLLFAHQTASWRAQDQLTTRLQHSEAYFRALVRSSADPVVILDDQLTVRWVSPSITDLLGLDPARIVGGRMTDVVHPEDAAGVTGALASAGEAGATKTRSARVRHVDGRWRLIQAQVRDLRSDPDVGGLVLYCRDVTATARAAVEPDLALSTSDPATGLPNRSALTTRLGALLRDPAVPTTSLVLVAVDGLPGTDDPTVLRELTTRFTRVLRGDDWLARSGSAEFAVLVDGTIADAEVVATRLVAAVEPVATGTGTLRLTAVAGIAPLGADVDAGEGLRRGDLALRSARAAGPGRVRRHSDALRITQDRQESLRADLDRALADGQLRLVYQPVVDLALHRTVSVEALLRWRHPVYGEVSPAEFVPLAEESALITELSRWVLTEAMTTIAALPHRDLGVAVNISARHVRSGELVADVLRALETSGLPATRLVLEITESVLLDDAHVVDDLAALRQLGVRIAVDDFGTGWSSLAYLVGLPIDVLKMDRQFLSDVETDPQRRALCASVLHLGSSLGLSVVVEGVETEPELQLLRDMGHRYIQGFLLARPMDVAALPAGLPGIAGPGTATGVTSTAARRTSS